jgi:hypothetical protein
LPLGEHDPQARLARVTQETGALKRSHQAQGVQTIEELSDHTFTTLFTLFARVAAASRPFNLVVTNVPGPQFQAYMLGAPMTACYPLVPLYNNQALGIALFSNAGKLFWGFNADWDSLPDLHELVGAVEASFAELRKADPDAGRLAAARGASPAPLGDIQPAAPARLSAARRKRLKKRMPKRGVHRRAGIASV